MKYKKNIITVVLLALITYAFQNPFFEIAKQIEIYNEVFKVLNINYINDLNPGELTKKALTNTLKGLDPYTNFYDEQLVEKAMIRRQGEYGGIGISTYFSKEGITVKQIFEGFPADRAGLKPGDLITNVNGQELKGLEREQLSMILKGNPGKDISLKIKREKSYKSFNLKLDKIVIDPVPFYEMIDQETGYIVLTRFTNIKATYGVRKAFKELKEKGMKNLVFDLRSNPGGSLNDAVNITNLFVPKGSKIVNTKGKLQQANRTYKANQEPLDLEIPIVVLIDDRSASASEIVSGALQDYDRAVVMGERSFGKGLVQRYFNLSYGTQVKVTISKYYTPSGRCIQELDYANRNSKTGKVPKFSDGTINEFKTKNGRKVYDGGGVTPDIKINKTEKNKKTKKLLTSRAIFDFVNHYYKNKYIEDKLNFTVSDTDFVAFKKFLQTKDTAFVTKSEKMFKNAYKSVKKNNKITSDYKNLIKNLKAEKVLTISENKDAVISKITDEVLLQKFYEKDRYKYHLKNDKTIKQALTLLKNTKKYQTILKN